MPALKTTALDRRLLAKPSRPARASLSPRGRIVPSGRVSRSTLVMMLTSARPGRMLAIRVSWAFWRAGPWGSSMAARQACFQRAFGQQGKVTPQVQAGHHGFAAHVQHLGVEFVGD